MQELKRKCPICCNNIREMFYDENIHFEDNNPMLKHYSVVRCAQCNFIFVDVDTNQSIYDNYYFYFLRYENIENAEGRSKWSWKN